jgi:hypothetical protein
MNLITKNEQGVLVADLAGLAKIRTRDSRQNPLGVGEVLVLNLSTKPAKVVEGEEIPLFDIGAGRTIDIDHL